MRAGVSAWVGSVEAGDLGAGEAERYTGVGGKVGCQWRVWGEGWGCLYGDGDGHGGEGLFG